MPEDLIKEAFSKVKQDILNLQSQLHSLIRELQIIKQTLNQKTRQTDRQTNQTDIPAQQTEELTELLKMPLNTLKSQNFDVSTGNDGVPTDRQTNRQTDRQTKEVRLTNSKQDAITHITNVSEVLDSLDAIKKDLRLKFKKLTSQEMLIFSTIYQLEEQGLVVDYSLISKKTNLSESSIRDYTQKLLKKGIPVDKIRENNKKITLSVHPDLKKIASLHTIISLREL